MASRFIGIKLYLPMDKWYDILFSWQGLNPWMWFRNFNFIFKEHLTSLMSLSSWVQHKFIIFPFHIKEQKQNLCFLWSFFTVLVHFHTSSGHCSGDKRYHILLTFKKFIQIFLMQKERSIYISLILYWLLFKNLIAFVILLGTIY